jgi:hypothetical protein
MPGGSIDPAWPEADMAANMPTHRKQANFMGEPTSHQERIVSMVHAEIAMYGTGFPKLYDS